MLVFSSTLTLSSTPQAIGSHAGKRRQILRAYADSGTMYVGDENVTTSTGQAYPYTGAAFELYQAHPDDLSPGAKYYAVGGGETVRVMEVLTG